MFSSKFTLSIENKSNYFLFSYSSAVSPIKLEPKLPSYISSPKESEYVSTLPFFYLYLKSIIVLFKSSLLNPSFILPMSSAWDLIQVYFCTSQYGGYTKQKLYITVLMNACQCMLIPKYHLHGRSKNLNLITSFEF